MQRRRIAGPRELLLAEEALHLCQEPSTLGGRGRECFAKIRRERNHVGISIRRLFRQTAHDHRFDLWAKLQIRSGAV